MEAAAHEPEVVIWPGRWCVADFQTHEDSVLVVFGDNDMRRGRGGQAVVRSLRCAVGIPTKRAPSMRQDAFYTDADFLRQRRRIMAAFAVIQRRMQRPGLRAVILPEDGWGTGLARLPQKAPKTFALLHRIYCALLGGRSKDAAYAAGQRLQAELRDHAVASASSGSVAPAEGVLDGQASRRKPST